MNIKTFISITLGLTSLFAIGQSIASPEIQHWQTSKGMRVYFVSAPELPMVDLQLVFDAGSARDGKSPGLARLTTGLLDEGSGDWDADAIARRFEDVGAQYTSGVEWDFASLSLRSLSAPEFLEPALETYINVVSNPSFPQRDFERLKRLMLVSLQNEAQRPGSVGRKAFYREVYGNHPFASPQSGTEQGIKTITRGDVERFYREYFGARNGLLAIVGDLDRAAAERIAQRISHHLVIGKKATPLPDVVPLTQSKSVLIPFPSAQAHVFIGQPGMRRGDPDYFPLYVGNHILGGSGFSSRLVKEVRVKRGLSYSVYSYFSPQSVEGPFSLGLQTRIDQADQAATLAKQTIRDFIQNGPSEEELQASIKNITGGFPLRIDSNADIVGYLAIIGFYNLPLNYLDTFNDKVTSVTQASVREAFKRRLDVDHMTTIVVGSKNQGG